MSIQVFYRVVGHVPRKLRGLAEQDDKIRNSLTEVTFQDFEGSLEELCAKYPLDVFPSPLSSSVIDVDPGLNSQSAFLTLLEKRPGETTWSNARYDPRFAMKDRDIA